MRIDKRRMLAVAAPVLVPVVMSATFGTARRRLDDRDAYLAGFAAYWAVCAGFSVAILGRHGLAEAFGKRSSRQGERTVLDIALLAWPAAGAIATRFIPALPTATKPMIATTAAVAETNAVLEELMWRASYTQLWPDNFLLGYIWPAVGFAAWHLAPQLIHPSAMGPRSYLVATLLLGLSGAGSPGRRHDPLDDAVTCADRWGCGKQSTRTRVGLADADDEPAADASRPDYEIGHPHRGVCAPRDLGDQSDSDCRGDPELRPADHALTLSSRAPAAGSARRVALAVRAGACRTTRRRPSGQA